MKKPPSYLARRLKIIFEMFYGLFKFYECISDSIKGSPISMNGSQPSINGTLLPINVSSLSMNVTLLSINVTPLSINVTPLSINVTPLFMNGSVSPTTYPSQTTQSILGVRHL